jgi:hypothetical protein
MYCYGRMPTFRKNLLPPSLRRISPHQGLPLPLRTSPPESNFHIFPSRFPSAYTTPHALRVAAGQIRTHYLALYSLIGGHVLFETAFPIREDWSLLPAISPAAARPAHHLPSLTTIQSHSLSARTEIYTSISRPVAAVRDIQTRLPTGTSFTLLSSFL